MAFMGETVDIGVAELLSVLARRRHAGRLSISVEGNEVQLFLLDGKVILVSSTHHGLRLGRVLVRLRVLDEERLEQARSGLVAALDAGGVERVEGVAVHLP